MRLYWGRRSAERQKERVRKYTNEFAWHQWFAWRPVRVGGFEWRWLERVWRRRASEYGASIRGRYVQYGHFVYSPIDTMAPKE